MADLCKHCGKPESEHHEFENVRPVGCVCNITWAFAGGLVPICANYLSGDKLSWCARCGHDRACHAPKD